MRGCQLLKKRSDAFVLYKTNHGVTSNKIDLFHIKTRLMHTFIINVTLLTLCHSDVFQSSKGHHQEV